MPITSHSKPIVFFSHSSRDKPTLIILRELFKQRTGNTIEVFLSSDGQSVRFGKNWVHEVEAALRDAKLMFVFLSPQSLRSQWVLFEAGHAYATGLQVVPVGMWGVDVGAVGPPLSLLQGFNITSLESLSNIIAISNEVFQFTHQPFTSGDYAAIFSRGLTGSPFGEYGSFIEELRLFLIGTDLNRDATSFGNRYQKWDGTCNK